MANIKNLANEISKQFENYTEQVKKDINKAKNQVSKSLVENIVRDSPEKTGSYKAGWRIKRKGISNIIHNATDYQLTHLLEKGHVKKNGGRVQPQIHIGPNEEKAVKEFERRVKGAIEPK